MSPRPWILLLVAVPQLALAKRPRHPAAPPAVAEVKLTDADCAKIAQHVLDLQVDEMRRTDAAFRALGGAEQLSTVEQMRQDPEIQQLARGCGKDLSRAEADCILKSRQKSESEACVAAPRAAAPVGAPPRAAKRRR